MATSDGGASWTRQYAGPADLDQVDFIDGEHGWAAGGDTLLRTTNGGASWTRWPSRARASSARSTSSRPPLGYAVAAGDGREPGSLPAGGPYTTALGGSLLRTTDGGSTWSPVTGAPANPQSACFANADDGYLGTPARIWRTTDGGQHWTLALTEPGASGNPTTRRHPGDRVRGRERPLGALPRPGRGDRATPRTSPTTARTAAQWHGVLEEQYTESALGRASSCRKAPAPTRARSA